MTLKVKICGITEQEGFRAAIEGGADFIGFIFCEKKKSKCYMEPESANEILQTFKEHSTLALPKLVGVFMNPSNEDLETTLKHIPLDYIQLHSDESAARVAEIKKLTNLPVIKVFRVAAQEHLDKVPTYEGIADFFLFDTLTTGPTAGGTGKTFDWTLVQDLKTTTPWLLAGGLNETNIAQAIEISGAQMVDVSTGVEWPDLRNNKRVKNPQKVKNFLMVAKQL